MLIKYSFYSFAIQLAGIPKAISFFLHFLGIEIRKVVHLKDKRVSIRHRHSLLYKHLIDRYSDTLSLLWSHFNSSRCSIIVVNWMAKISIWHLHCSLPTNKS